MREKIAYKCDSIYEFEFITNHYYEKGYEKDSLWHYYFVNKISYHSVCVVIFPEDNHIGFFMNYNIEPVINAKQFIRKLKLNKINE